MKVYFSHGKESGPWGRKFTSLARVAKKHGFSVDSIDYTDIRDPELRVERLVELLKRADDDFVLLGSSMGGYVSLVASERVNAKGVFLLAPALFMPGYKAQSYRHKSPVEIVHGWSDDVVPPENSIKFAQQNDCSLHLISGDHRLNSFLAEVEALFAQFLVATTARVKAQAD